MRSFNDYGECDDRRTQSDAAQRSIDRLIMPRKRRSPHSTELVAMVVQLIFAGTRRAEPAGNGLYRLLDNRATCSCPRG